MAGGFMKWDNQQTCDTMDETEILLPKSTL